MIFETNTIILKKYGIVYFSKLALVCKMKIYKEWLYNSVTIATMIFTFVP